MEIVRFGWIGVRSRDRLQQGRVEIVPDGNRENDRIRLVVVRIGIAFGNIRLIECVLLGGLIAVR